MVPRSNGSTTLVVGLGLGLLSGVALARFYTPLSGQQARQALLSGSQQLLDHTHDQLVGVRDRVSLRLGRARIRSRDALSRLHR